MSDLIANLKYNWRKHFWGFRPFKRHSLVLMVAGVFYAVTGAILILSKPTENRKISLSVALNFFPLEVWGSVFVVAGLLAFISSRWPPVADTWGYMVLSGLSAGWSATYAAGVMFEESPMDNLTGTVVWGLLAFLWWAISGFVNPDKTIVVVINDEGTTN